MEHVGDLGVAQLTSEVCSAAECLETAAFLLGSAGRPDKLQAVWAQALEKAVGDIRQAQQHLQTSTSN